MTVSIGASCHETECPLRSLKRALLPRVELLLPCVKAAFTLAPAAQRLASSIRLTPDEAGACWKRRFPAGMHPAASSALPAMVRRWWRLEESTRSRPLQIAAQCYQKIAATPCRRL